MFCCDKCEDHLEVPKGAIKDGEEYSIIQSFPFVCSNNDLSSDYTPICVKEYYTHKTCLFQVHVRLVAYFTAVMSYEEIRVRYSVSNGMFAEAQPFDISLSENQQNDVYFKLSGTRVEIRTKHFTIFIIDKKKSKINLFSRSTTQRIVDLVMHAYYRVNEKERSVVLRVYILDTKLTNCKEITDKKEINDGNKLLYINAEPLSELPKYIKYDTKFQCVAIFSKSKWNKLISSEV